MPIESSLIVNSNDDDEEKTPTYYYVAHQRLALLYSLSWMSDNVLDDDPEWVSYYKKR